MGSGLIKTQTQKKQPTPQIYDLIHELSMISKHHEGVTKKTAKR
jgi:hypothetical protein